VRNEQAAQSTLSLWSALLEPSPAPEFLSLCYVRTEETLWLNPCQAELRIWKEYWFRFHNAVK